MTGKKILVSGFPHSGTSILRTIVGHIPDVRDVPMEAFETQLKSDDKFVVYKQPFFLPEYANRQDTHIIMVMRNPLWIYSSLNRRFGINGIPHNHSMEAYVRTLEQFKRFTNDPQPRMHLIRYEDMFENNFMKLKKIFKNLGLEYSDEIFDNTKYENMINKTTFEKIETEPPARNQGEFRNWQIQQPFVNNNDPKKIQLTTQQMRFLTQHPTILEFYPDIKDILMNISSQN